VLFACAGTLSSFLLSRDSLTSEELLVVDALLAVFESRVNSSSDDLRTLHALMREIFPSSVRLRSTHGYEPQTAESNALNDAIVAEIRAKRLQPDDNFVNKVHAQCHCGGGMLEG